MSKTTLVVYKYDGETRELTIPFDYLRRVFVKVYLEGDTVQQKLLELGVDYKFISPTTIIMLRPYNADEGFTRVYIKRVTDASKALVSFQDGSILNANELNISQLQTLHVADEARDLAVFTLGLNERGELDASNRPIVNIRNTLPLKDNEAASIGTVKNLLASIEAGYTHSLETIESLRAFEPKKDYQFVVVKGYYLDTVKGGGIFVYDPEDLITEDDGGYCIVSGKFRWKRLEEPTTPQDFGAKGDGINDDTNFIQNLIDYKASKGGIIHFPEGKYAISNKIVIAGGIEYLGVSPSSSFIIKHSRYKINNPTGGLMFVTKGWDTASGYEGASDGVIKNLCFDEDNPASNVTAGDAIAIGHAKNWLIENCVFKNMKYHGVDAAGSKEITVRNCKYYGTKGQSYNAFQADQAAPNSILGINPDNTPSINITFENNYVTGASVESLGPQSAAFHIHRKGNSNISVLNNIVENCDFLVQTDPSSFNSNINIDGNKAVRGTVAGASATCIKIRGRVKTLNVTNNFISNYNIGVSLDGLVDSGFNEDISVVNNNIEGVINTGVFITKAYRSRISGNNITSLGKMVDSGILFSGCNYFTCDGNIIYNGKGYGISIEYDKAKGISSSGQVLNNKITNGKTAMYCNEYARDILFYNNMISGSFTENRIVINENLTNVRNLGFAGKSVTFTVQESGSTIQPNTVKTVSFTASGCIAGDVVSVGFFPSDATMSSGDDLIFYGCIVSYQSGRIKIFNPTSAPLVLEKGMYRVIVNSSRFFSFYGV